MNNDLFSFVVTFFSTWCWQALGKISNPATGKVEKNLDTAKHSIDVLEMLKEKTKGNLSKDEEKLIEGIIAELQINFVEELKNKDSSIKEGEEKEDGESSEDKGKTE